MTKLECFLVIWHFYPPLGASGSSLLSNYCLRCVLSNRNTIGLMSEGGSFKNQSEHMKELLRINFEMSSPFQVAPQLRTFHQ